MDEQEEQASGADNAAAMALVLNAAASDGRVAAEAGAYLASQNAFVQLQMEHLHEQRALQLSHLKWRRFGDQLDGAWRIVLIALGLVVLGGGALLLWNASRADGLVVDGFHVPPSYAARGIDGEVLTDDLTGRLRGIRGVVNGGAFYSATSDIGRTGENDIKAEIPETGISVAELWRFLRGWLGHEKHVSGALIERTDGTIALQAQIPGAKSVEVTGAAADLPALEQKLSERVFAAFDPINAVLYYWALNRDADAAAQAFANTQLDLPAPERADAYVLWAEDAHYHGQLASALSRLEFALAIYPKLLVAYVDIGQMESKAGHDETAVRAYRAGLAQPEAAQPLDLQGDGFRRTAGDARFGLNMLTGEYGAALSSDCAENCDPDAFEKEAIVAAELHDVDRAQKALQMAEAAGRRTPLVLPFARFLNAQTAGDEAGAVAALHAVKPDPDLPLAIFRDALLAEVLAAHGDVTHAEALVAAMPSDCVRCLEARGNVRAAEHKWGAAQFWFAKGAAAAPSTPFADYFWARMLLAKGDTAAAIAKLANACRIAPHFADGLELWGEALTRANRSDLALEKFAQAAQLAPHWGRLHLEWGAALFYAGKPGAARREFARAAKLALSPPENVALAAWQARAH